MKKIDKFVYDTTINTDLAIAILPIDLQSGQITNGIIKAHLYDDDYRIGLLNNSGYYLFMDLETSSKYDVLLESDYYIPYKNNIDLKTFDYDARVNPNFESLMNGNEEHDNKFKRPDRSLCIFLNNQYSLSEFVNSGRNTSNNFSLIKYISLYPSKETRLQIILTKISRNVIVDNDDDDVLTATRFTNHEIPILDAKVSIEKLVNAGNPLLTSIIIQSDINHENNYEFSTLDSHVISTPIIKSNSILGNRKYVKFDSVPNTDADVEININIQRNSKSLTVPKIRLEKSMTTMINILIID
jgi:hypothetical protein